MHSFFSHLSNFIQTFIDDNKQHKNLANQKEKEQQKCMNTPKKEVHCIHTF